MGLQSDPHPLLLISKGRAKQQREGALHLVALFTRLCYPAGEVFLIPDSSIYTICPILSAFVNNPGRGILQTNKWGGCEWKEKNTCSCSWPTDLPLMCCLRGNQGISGYAGALACGGACRKEFYDQKMWGLVCGQKQWWKVQNEKLCQDKGTQSQNNARLGRLKKGTQNQSHNWINNWLIPFFLLMLLRLAVTCWNRDENAAASSIHCLYLGFVLARLGKATRKIYVPLSSIHVFFPLNGEFRAKLPTQLQPRAGGVLADLQNNCGSSRIVCPAVTEVKFIKILCTYF